MKIIKPLKLGLYHRPVFEAGSYRLAVAVVAVFPLDAPTVLLPEVNLWKLVAAEMGERPVLDEWFPKARGEVLVTGKACPPGGEAPACQVRVKVGAVDKTLMVFGDRFWGALRPTQPVPFRTLPVRYENAFGGEGYEWNPLGKGMVEIATEHGALRPLPNVEDPRALVAAPGDRPKPAGFGPYDGNWPQRARKRGTYGEKWLKERYPGFPEDMQPTFFNVAPEDQQIEGFFRGDEALVIENMHPAKSLIESALPGIAGRAFLLRAASGGFEEVPLALETVHLFPSAERGVVLFRGSTAIADDAASDVSHMMVAADVLGAPRPVAHYESAFAQRIDPKKRALFALRTRDLLPDRRVPSHPGEIFSDMDELVATKKLLEKNHKRGAERRLLEVRERVAQHGHDPDAFGFPVSMLDDEPQPDVEELEAYVDAQDERAASLAAQREKKQADMEANSRALCAEHKLDYDKMMADGKKQAAGPPKGTAELRLAELREQAQLARNAGMDPAPVEALINDPEFVELLMYGEDARRQMYRRSAHMYPPADALGPEAAAALREEVRCAHAAGETLAERDLTGADLHGMDLRGASLGMAFLENANLADADLSGADLHGAVLARARLGGAKLVEADLQGANLGGADATAADFGAARLGGATLMRVRLSQACLRGAHLERANLLEAEIDRSDFGAIHGGGIMFIKADLRGVKFDGARLPKAVFVECNLEGVDFTGADLTKATFVTCRADGAIFRGATLEGASFPKDTSLAGAIFSDARMPLSNLRGAKLAGANLAGATADQADFSDADLTDANCHRLVAKGSLWIRSDLRRANLTSADLSTALLQWANIRETTFKGANLFRADFAFINGDRGTSFEDAFMEQIRFVKRNTEAAS